MKDSQVKLSKIYVQKSIFGLEGLGFLLAVLTLWVTEYLEPPFSYHTGHNRIDDNNPLRMFYGIFDLETYPTDQIFGGIPGYVLFLQKRQDR